MQVTAQISPQRALNFGLGAALARREATSKPLGSGTYTGR